jgi:hypothetical protein
MSAAISAVAKIWLGVSWNGSAASARLLQAAVALGRAAGERAVVMAHQRDRELARQQFVERERARAGSSATGRTLWPAHVRS